MRPILARSIVAALAGLIAGVAAAQVAVTPARWTVAEVALPAAVWYPTAAAATPQRVGPFRINTAPADAVITPGRHPLVLISHGTGGHDLAHAWLAEQLAAAGFVVAALRHPGDHFEDRSAVTEADYFDRRPRQLSLLLDALLADPRWAISIDSRRIAAVGHSAGGYSVLALAGALPSPARAVAHCAPDGIGRREDAAMCALGGRRSEAVLESMLSASASVRDARVRAVVALAPLGLPLDAAPLANNGVAVHLEVPGRDAVLAPRWHGLALCAALPRARCEVSESAGHFASFQAGTGPLPSAAGDPSADPAGFDREAWQRAAAPRILQSLRAALR